MAIRVEPGPGAGPGDLHRARARERFLRDELPRVQSAALAWRNGLAGVLAALLGFGLIKGRTDVSALRPPWAAAAGALLVAALVTGLLGALALLRAAHGLPVVRPTRTMERWQVTEHREALAAAGALRQGIAWALACVTVLVVAVGITWYGPSRSGGRYVQVNTDSGRWCGRALRMAGAEARLETSRGPIVLPVTVVRDVAPVATCR